MYRYMLVASFVLVIQSCATFHVSPANSFANRNHRDNSKRIGSPRFDLEDIGLQVGSGETVDNPFEDEDDDDDDQQNIAAKNRHQLLNVLRVKSLLSSLRGAADPVHQVPIDKDTLVGEKDANKELKESGQLSTNVFKKNSRDPYNRRLRSQIRKSGGGSDQYGRVVSPEVKRGEGPSLSIVGPLEVLRQSKLWDTARRRYVANQERIRNNERILADKGKRSVPDDYSY